MHSIRAGELRVQYKEFVPLQVDSQVLMFHGFPGRENNQNEDLGEFLASNSNSATLVAYYPGLEPELGSDGVSNRFLFKKSIQSSEALLIHRYNVTREPVSLVGHSWGGFVALRLQQKHPDKVRKLVLAAPLLAIPDYESLFPLVDSFWNDLFDVFPAGVTKEDIVAELNALRFVVDPNVLARCEVHVVAASSDTEISFSQLRAFTDENEVELRVVDSDHKFLRNRERFFEEVLRALSD